MEDREKVIRRQVEATCGNEYHFYTEDVLHLLVIIDSLRASQKELVGILREAVDEIAAPPDANCSCHLSPPCNDCVTYGYTRDILTQAIQVIDKAKGDHK